LNCCQGFFAISFYPGVIVRKTHLKTFGSTEMLVGDDKS